MVLATTIRFHAPFLAVPRVMSSLQLCAQGCVELMDAQVAAAAVLDARGLAMALRLGTAVDAVAQGAAALLHVATLCAEDMRGAAAATLKYACATLTDAVDVCQRRSADPRGNTIEN